jgi:hypothetical protein
MEPREVDWLSLRAQMEIKSGLGYRETGRTMVCELSWFLPKIHILKEI